ncbi:MAG: anthranilate synthase component I [Gammaproteobacteria bacterium]|nr:anthranilate synthase component I [Gammaproteobacteria bacterium]|tara:strand:- start:2367 stop:3848 length:1482 start_codon:yes stop_codon:yes gene_type:complete
MNIEQFNELAGQGYNRIPLTREVLADLETPLSVYLKLANSPYSYFLESVQGGEKWGRYSIIGLPCSTVLKVSGNNFTLERDGKQIESFNSNDPFDDIAEFQSAYRIPELEGLPRFNGGLVGYFGYDTIRYVEHRVADSTPTDTVGTPDILLMVSEEVIVFDNLRGTITLLVYADPAQDKAFESAQKRLDDLSSELHQPLDPALFKPVPQAREVDESSFVSSFGKQAYESAVEKIKDYIVAGDVMQVVLAQRMSIPFDGEAINVYRALRQLNPSPYMVYMDLADFHIVSASPEILARVEDGHITVRPLAGTRRRGHTEEEDLALEKDLLADEKEIAEHLMLIDLSRNDSGRVSRTGSVKVTRQMFVERYSHVMHIASNVESEIAEDKTALDVLKATLPVGTLSGAPKVRAMEIIDEFEPVKRGVYGGAMGYLSWNGNMDMAIAIRTAVIKDETLYVEAGAGIVADSVPELEWKETMNKARALFSAVKLAEEGMQ